MKIFSDFEKIKEPIVISIGTYDAVHLGHLEIINRMKNLNLKTCIVSFYPPPFIFFGLEEKVLFTIEEKIEIFKDLGIDYLFFIEFNENIKNLTSDEFIKILNSNLDIKYLIVGKSFKFGKNKEGDRKKLEELSNRYGFKIELIEEKKVEKEKISSSKIRKLIKIGEIEHANRFLYKNYFVIGKKENDNLIIDSLKLIPPDGKYFVKINNEEKEKIVEIINKEIIIKENIFSEKIKIEFLNKINETI